MTERAGPKVGLRVWVAGEGGLTARQDDVAGEEPLEIRVASGDAKQTVAVTMRTPGSDFELAAGFLHSEGVIAGRDDIARIRYCLDRDVEEDQRYNIVSIELRSGLPSLDRLERHFYTNSSCGVCGKASLEALSLRGCAAVAPGPSVPAEIIRSLPEKLSSAQGLFRVTGGLHAAALFDAAGSLLCVREDVGRHNALDKLLGWALLEGRLPAEEHIVLVSGRSSFEILQKCLVARVPIICSVSAPSSLAVAVAEEFGLTLIGFLREHRFNVYAGPQRVQLA